MSIAKLVMASTLLAASAWQSCVAAAPGGCGMPLPAPADKIVVLGTNGGGPLSSVAIHSPDLVTHTTKVTVEPGMDRIYLVLLAGSPVVFVVDGAVNRIS